MEFKGKKGLIFGVANHRSIAYFIAKELSALGAEIGYSYQSERVLGSVEKSLKELNLLDDFSSKRKNHSSIFNIKLNEKDFKFLINNNVRCVKRGDGVRVSVHFYNSIEDIKSFISILKRLN